MKKAFLIIFLAFSAVLAKAQNPKNAVLMEIGGSGFLYSLNYERNFAKNWLAKAGFSFVHFKELQTEKQMQLYAFPVSVSYLKNIFAEKHFLETGFGVMNVMTSGNMVEYRGATDWYLNPHLIVAYRYRTARNWHFRLAFTPFYGTKSLSNPTEFGFSPFGTNLQLWGGLGFGKSF